jgi:hypothetical protein
MNIFTFKQQFELIVQPPPSCALIGAKQAWENFKSAVQERLEGAHCEEVGFSMSTAAHFDGTRLHSDENLFQIYFGRLIDAEKNESWRTAEINFYYRFEMDASLRRLLSGFQPHDFEIAFCSHEPQEQINQKIETVFAFAEQRQALWDEIWAMTPVESSFHFWIQ